MSDEDDVARVVRTAFVEFYRGHDAKVCRLLTPAGRRALIRSSRRGSRATCQAAVHELSSFGRTLRAGAPDAFDHPRVEVTEISETTARATASVDVKGFDAERFRLRKVRGAWRIDDIH